MFKDDGIRSYFRNDGNLHISVNTFINYAEEVGIFSVEWQNATVYAPECFHKVVIRWTDFRVEEQDKPTQANGHSHVHVKNA
jgi:hypothetical protein